MQPLVTVEGNLGQAHKKSQVCKSIYIGNTYHFIRQTNLPITLVSFDIKNHHMAI